MWTTAQIPLPIQQQLIARGSRPVELKLYEHGAKKLAVIVSHDPSGLDGATEIHASISASVIGYRIRPTMDDVTVTVKELGLGPHTVDARPGADVVHIWAPLK
jgi:hypothetical protein